VTDLADAYIDLLDAFGLIGMSVLGTSFGGWVASRDGRTRPPPARVPPAPHRRHRPRDPRAHTHRPRRPPPATTCTQPPAARRGPSPAAMAALRSYAGPAMSNPDRTS
jgi:hypothetical protein